MCGWEGGRNTRSNFSWFDPVTTDHLTFSTPWVEPGSPQGEANALTPESAGNLKKERTLEYIYYFTCRSLPEVNCIIQVMNV